MGNYKVYFNGVQYKEIDAVEEIDIEFERDIVEKGFVTKYSQKLTVFGSAYQFLKALAPCDNVDVLIEYKCNNTWETLAEGFIIAKDIEYNESRCTADVSIEDNSVAATFLEAKDRDVLFNIDDLYVLQNFKDIGGNLLAETDGTDYARSITVFGAIDHILKNISNDALRLRSDFLSTVRQNPGTSITVSALANGDVLTMNFLDEYNNSYELNTTYVNPTGTLLSPELTFRTRITTGLNDLFDYHVFVDVQATSVNSFTILIDFHGQQITSFGASATGTTTVSVTNVNYVEGMGGLHISNGYMLSSQRSKPFLLSFDTIYDIISKLFDLSYAFEIDGGQTYLRIEPISYFLNEDNIINVGDVDVYSNMYDDTRIGKGVRIGKEENESNLRYFNNLDCNNLLDRTISANVHTRTRDITDQITGNEDFGDDLFLIEGKGLGIIDEPLEYKRTDFFNPSFIYYVYYNQLIDGAIDYLGNTTNLIQGNRNLLRYHLNFLPDELQYPTYQKTKTNTAATIEVQTGDTIGFPMQYLTVQKFKHYLQFHVFRQINGFTMIQFTCNGQVRYGFILDFKYKQKTGETDFTLLVK